MENLMKILLWVTVALPMANCSEDHQNLPIDELKAKLVTLDEEGIEKNVFETGTNITFALKIVNRSNEYTEAGNYFDYCGIYQIEEFLLVYKWAKKSENEEESWVSFGKAYVPPINCLTINLPVVVPANGEISVAGSSWSNNPDNTPLTPGKYYTAFSYTLELNGQPKKLDLKAEFEVQ